MAERGRRVRRDRDDTPEFGDRLVAINRVSKTVKGGKRFGFAALVVVGDQRGRVGFGKGKAKEVPEAIRKATEQAKRCVVRVPLREGRTLHHDIQGRNGAGKVVMRTAPEGTGIIAGGPMRAVFEMLGVKDVVAKSVGSQNPYNMIRATMEGLGKEQSPRNVAMRRGKTVANILPKRTQSSSGKVDADATSQEAVDNRDQMSGADEALDKTRLNPVPELVSDSKAVVMTEEEFESDTVLATSEQESVLSVDQSSGGVSVTTDERVDLENVDGVTAPTNVDAQKTEAAKD